MIHRLGSLKGLMNLFWVSCLCLLMIMFMTAWLLANNTELDSRSHDQIGSFVTDSSSTTSIKISDEEHFHLAEVQCRDTRKPRYDYFSYIESSDSSTARELLVFSFAFEGDVIATSNSCLKRYDEFGNPAKIISFSEGGMNGSYLLIADDPKGDSWSKLPDYSAALSGLKFKSVSGVNAVDWDSSGYISAIHIARPMRADEMLDDYLRAITNRSARCYIID